jgi:4-hydroxybenzoate polyprenyltransferase
MSTAAKRNYERVSSLAFWKAFWLTMRPYLIFVSGAAGLVGLAFIENPSLPRVALAFFPLLLSYGLGQALTDCFQMDTDRISSPYRPLIQGIISRRQVMSVSLAGLVAGILVLTFLNPFILLPGALAVIGLLSYTRLKRKWWGGPPWNSWIVALLPVIGRLVDRDFRPQTIFSLAGEHALAFLLSLLAVFCAYANFVVMGYFKDISADRATGYRTFPVVFGWKAAAVYSDFVAGAAALFTGLALYALGKPGLPGIALFVAALAVNLQAQVKIHRTREEGKSYGPISNVVRSFILYSASIILTLQVNWIAFLAVFYLLFEYSLRRRPETSQV